MTSKTTFAALSVLAAITAGAAIAGIATAFLQPTEASAGIFDSLATADWKTVTSTRYKIDAYGYDVRAYEWTPETAPQTTCVMAFSESGPVGMQCFDKK